jgi:SHS2 domain-containing protein
VPYEPLDHTADVGFILRAPTRDALFVAALEAFTDTVTELAAVAPRIERRLAVAADDLPGLLVEWLEELVYRFEVDGLLFAEATIEIEADPGESGGGLRLVATARGEPFDAERHPLKVLVKAVTYHGLEAGRDSAGTGWTAQVILDI